MTRLPTNNLKENRRADIDQSNGWLWSVNVRPDKKRGGWRVCVKFRRKNSAEDQLFMRSAHCKDRQEIGKSIAELLRWVDKSGFDSEMADHSRTRGFKTNAKSGESTNHV